MSDRCKELVKLAKRSEKQNRLDSVELYKQAANCFSEVDDLKSKVTNFKRAAELLQELAKLSESPIIAYDHLEHSSSIYTDIGNENEAKKIMQQASQNFIDEVMKIRSETKQISDIELAEQRLKLGSQYALRGNNEKLSNECWIDLGDKIRQIALGMEDPEEAYELFMRAILNYQKAKAETKEFVTLKHIAEKFNKRADEVYNKKKNLAHALDNYNKALKFYQQIKTEDKAQFCNKRIKEICDIIGVQENYIIEFLKTEQKIISPLPKRDPQIIETQKVIDPQQNVVGEYFKKIKQDVEEIKQPLADIRKDKPVVNVEKTKPVTPIVTDLPKADQSQPISDLMEALDENIKSSEKIKKRIKEEIKQGKPKSKKEKRGEKKKTKEINKLFDKALDKAMEEFESKSDEIIANAKSEKSPMTPIPKIKTPIEKEEIITENKVAQQIDKINHQVINEDTIIGDSENNINVTNEKFKPIKKPESDEKTKFSHAVVNALKEKDDFQAKLVITKTVEKPVKTIEPADSRNIDIKQDQPILRDTVVSTLHDLKPVNEKDRLVIGSSIINILQKQGYIDSKLSSEKELYRVPEYEILSIILNHHPIALEQLEKKSKLDSISLVLSNLQADGLIEQTNDYEWTLSVLTWDNLEKPQHQPIGKADQDNIQKLRARVERNSTFEKQFILAMYEEGLIQDRNKSLTTLMKNPNFAILRTIKNNEPAELSYIKEELFNIPPVQITRILSRLQVDDMVSKNNDDLWELSDSFVKKIVKN